MDMLAIRDEALEMTARFFRDRKDDVPDQDTEEWEAEYRRQFEAAKRRQALRRTAAPAAPLVAPASAWPALHGTDGEKRWGTTIREERLQEIANKDQRAAVAGAVTAAKDWIDTRDLPTPQFLRRFEAQVAQQRQRAAEAAAQRDVQRRAQAAAAPVAPRPSDAQHLTAQALIDLIDVSPRVAPATAKAPLATLTIRGRSLKIFESSRPKALVVVERTPEGRNDFSIERDDKLAGDIKLYGLAHPG